MTKNILIIEDEMIIAASNEIILKELGYDFVKTASDCNEIKEILDNNSIDLVLLDINLGMEEINGIDIAKYLSSIHIPYIFVTSYIDKDTVDNALSTNPLGYIVKPLSKPILYTQLEMAFKKMEHSYLRIKEAGKTYIIYNKNILYIHAEGNYCTIYTTENKIVVRSSLKKINELLASVFVQSHKAYIVNSELIVTIKENEVQLSDGSLVPLSRHFKENLHDKR